MTETDRANSALLYERDYVPAVFGPLADVVLQLAAPQPGERVLDVACGTGVVARQIPPLVGESGRVVAVDLDPGMLAVARSLPAPPGVGIEWRENNAMGLDLPDRAFDLVICQLGLMFFPDRPAAVSEMHRVLDGGGRALIATWQGLEKHPLTAALLEAQSRHTGLTMEQIAVPFSCGDPDALHMLLNEAGFSDVEVRPLQILARLPSAEPLISSVVRAAAALEPRRYAHTEASRALAEAIHREAAPVLAQYRDGDGLSSPMFAHLASGRR